MTTGSSTTETVFARLVQEHPNLSEIHRRVMRAFEELTHGRPQTTDGSLTVVNIAAEAGVGRASCYRSPVAAAIKEILAAPDSRRPEVDELKAEITRLRKAEQALRGQRRPRSANFRRRSPPTPTRSRFSLFGSLNQKTTMTG